MLLTVVVKRVDWALVSLNSNLAFTSLQVPEHYHAVRGTAEHQVTKYLRQKKQDCFNE